MVGWISEGKLQGFSLTSKPKQVARCYAQLNFYKTNEKEDETDINRWCSAVLICGDN